MTSSRLRTSLCGALFLLVGTASVLAAEPDLLYRSIGRDVGVCVEVSDLAKAWPQFRDSAWFQKLQSSPVAQAWTGSEDYRKLQQSRMDLEQVLQQPLVELVGDLFGQRAILAVYSRDKDVTVVIVTRARSSAVLQSALALWDRLEPATKTRKTAGDVPYFVRVPQKPGATVCYAVQGDVLFLSPSESELSRAVQTSADQSLLADARFKADYATIRDGAPLRVFARLRAWDSLLGTDDGPASGDKRRQVLARVLKASDSLTASVELRDGLVIDARLHYDPQASPAWQAFVSHARGRAKIFERVPSSALAAFGGRMRWGWVDAAVREVSGKPEEWERTLRVARGLCLGHDPIDSVAAGVGPEYCGYVAPQPTGAPEWAPLNAVVAFSLTPKMVDGGPTLAEGLHNAFKTGLNAWAAVRNAEGEGFEAVLRTREPMGVMVTWLSGLAAWQPAFASTASYLVLGSSPEAVEQFLQPEHPDSLATHIAFARWRDRECPEAGQVLWINVAQARDWLRLHGPKLVQHLHPNFSPEKSARRLERLDGLLQPLGSLFLGVQLDSDSARVVFAAAVSE